MPSYKDKNNTWYARFYYRDKDGQQCQKCKRGFKLKREADEFEREFRQSLKVVPASEQTFSEFYAVYCADINPRLREHTIQNREYRVKNRLMPFFGDRRLSDITPVIVREWQNGLITAGLSGAYMSGCHRQLSAILNHAVRFYGLAVNPCLSAGSIGGKKSRLEMNFWTLNEFETASAHIADIKAKTAITLLFWSGMRKGELLALVWSDINFDTNELTINKSYQRLRGKDVVTPPKTLKSIRKVLLPKQAIEALLAYKAVVFDTSASAPVFAWEKRFIELGIMKACTASGVKRIRVHDLRHSHASLLIELGYSPLLIAQRLGHEKIETTLNTYSHLWPSKELELVAELEQLNAKK